MPNPGKSVTFNGETRKLADWARFLGVKLTTLRRRLAKGMAAERALTAGLMYVRSGEHYPTVTVAPGVTKREHVVIAERALGGTLPAGAEVHHVDEDITNNAPGNLVICPSVSYHRLLHARMRARDATGDPNTRKCRFCHEWALPENLVIASSKSAYHQQCNTNYQRERRAASMINSSPPKAKTL
jgi:hypothetical protein